MYRIGLFSKITMVSVKTLRYYDEAGLLKPAFVDTENGYRYYTSEQLPLIHQILSLRQIGFSIDEIGGILGSSANVEGIFQQRKAELAADIEESRMQMLQIDHYMDCFKGEHAMEYQVVIKELPEVIVYSKRMIMPDYNAYFDLIPRIGREITMANPGLECAVPNYCFNIYHDGEYRERDIDVEVCEAVVRWGTETETIKFKKMDRVPEAACLYHKGPYSSLGTAYARLFQWIDSSGYLPVAPPRESYIDGIWNKEDESDWLTELQAPVCKKHV